MLILSFNANTQTCEMDKDGVKTEISIERAKELWLTETVDDFTLSFHRLVVNDFDGKAVADFYSRIDGQG